MNRRISDLMVDRGGSVAMIFGLCVLPLLFAMGVGVDYVRAAKTRAALQQAADAAVLAVVRSAPLLTQADFEQKARAYFDANFTLRDGVTVTAFTPTRVGAQVTVAATASVPTTFSRLMHPAPLEVTGSSTAMAGGKAVEVALVLDNTGSMNDAGKLPALKQSAKDFLSYLDKIVVSRNDAKVALIPFNTQVNLGTATKSATWLSYTKLNTVSSSTWKGCISDRDQPYDVQLPETAPPGTSTYTFSTANAYPADSCDTATSYGQPTLSQIVPLSTDYAALNSAIDAMTAGGNTNVGIGVAWGMEALTPSGPLGSAVALTNAKVQKVMIVLTDGTNTANRWGGNGCTTGWDWSQWRWVTVCNDMDSRTLSACQAAKDAGIVVYTVRVIDGNADMLKSCATEGRFFYNVLTADDLKPAFQNIGSSIAKFRLTQ